MKIRAAVALKKGSPYVIQEVELMEPKENDVLVKMVASGLCRSDYGERNGNSIAFPNVLGHEGSGIVESVGEGVISVKPGDHVIISYAYCNACESCNTGHPSGCNHWLDINNKGMNKRGEYTLSNENGPIHNFFNQSSFATYCLCDETNLVRVDKDIDLRILGPLGCGLGTGSGAVMDVLKPKAGASIAIYGTGAVGFASIAAAKICGCTEIIAVDINDTRLEMAKRFGATRIINSSTTDAKARILEAVPFGVDYTIDTTGVVSVMQECLAVLKHNGKFLPLAVTKEAMSFNPFFDLVFGNKQIIGVLIGDTIPKYHLPKLIDFYRKGLFPFDELIVFYDFEDINQAEADSINGKVIKPVVIIDKSYAFYG